jgi:dipeptidyl aminopeptidase/acylaminoacyl peptidase
MSKQCNLILTILTLATACGAAGPRGVTPEDYYAFRNVTDARLSPDGQQVAYVVTSVNAKQNRRVSEIWIGPAGAERAGWQLTFGPSSRMPRWSPDGRSIAFLSTRPAASGPAGHSNQPQVHVLSMSGGEASRLTDLEHGVDAFQWSATGDRLVCASKTPNKPKRAGASDVRHYTSIGYKFNDTGWYDNRRSHLFVVDAKTGAATQITSGEERNDTDPQWSPDGSRIAFVAEDTTRPALMSGTVWVIPAAGGPATRISDDQGTNRLPRWSPAGDRIAYASALTESDAAKIRIARATGEAKPVLASKNLDMAPSEIDWADESTLYFTAPTHGEIHIFAVDPGTAKFAQISSGPRAVRLMGVHKAGGMMLYTANDFKHLDDLYTLRLPDRREKRLTDVNSDMLSQLKLQDVERMVYKGADGWSIDGFFVKPIGWQPGRKYPMVLSIHGGPASMYGVDWFHEFQVYAARGWAVFFTNPRGSAGYGEKFQRAVEKQWGGKAYDDIMAGVDAILDKYDWIDRDRVGVTGGSYGGFMTNWILGHSTRFKAAITLRSISNFTSIEGTRDAAYSHARDFGGDLWENFDFYWNSSPLQYAKNVKTPTLILHSDNDQRVPLEQGEQWFRALKHYGVNTEFVIFPRENHNLTRNGEPKHLVESLNWQLYWFDRFLNGNETAVRPNER